VPPEFGADLLPPDLDRIADIMEAAMRRMPALTSAGIKKIVNGPITYTPDGNPLLGPAPGLRNHWLACGFSFGITQAGGCGRVLAEWIVEGAPSLDAREIDPRRYGRYADLDYAIARCTDIYENEYAIAYPFGETSVARRARVSPVYPLLAERGAVFGTTNGWEVPLWFARPGEETKDAPGFRGSGWFAGSLREVHLVRERVGVLDQSSLAKIEISGPDAEKLLARAVASPLPREVGDLGRALLLTPKGGVLADATLSRLAPDRYFLIAAAAAELRVLDALQSEDSGKTVRVENVTEDWGAFVVAGPKARDTVAKLATGTLDRFGFPGHSAQQISIADKPVRALEFDRAGEIGWTLVHRMEDQILLYRTLLKAGTEFGIRDFGHRAMNTLRLEHNHPAELDLGTETTPLEAGLEGLVDFDRAGFIGREALLSQRKAGPRRRLVMLEIDGLDELCRGGEAVFVGDRTVGLTTSGGQGSWVIASLAFATIEAEFARKYAEVQVEILGERRKAWVLPDGILDPGYTRPKT
jgi:dimethylglycine dehydrogenase